MKPILIITILQLLAVSLFAQENDSTIVMLEQRVSLSDSLLNSLKPNDKSRIEILSHIKNDQDSIITILKNVCSVDKKRIKDYEQKFAKMLFFTTSDTTVYSSKYIVIEDIDSYPPFMREYYQLISDLRKVNEKLSKVDAVITEADSSVKDLSDELKRAVLKEKTENLLKSIQDDLINIKGRDKSFLSSEQKEYFTVYLTEKYNRFLSMIFNDLKRKTT